MLVFLGRTHLYEGHGVDAVAHGVRTAAAAGCRAVVLTNACGGLREEWVPGTPVLISDHLNLTARSPLVGARFGVPILDPLAALREAIARDVIDTVRGGGVIFSYYPDPAWLKTSRYLNDCAN